MQNFFGTRLETQFSTLAESGNNISVVGKASSVTFQGVAPPAARRPRTHVSNSYGGYIMHVGL